MEATYDVAKKTHGIFKGNLIIQPSILSGNDYRALIIATKKPSYTKSGPMGALVELYKGQTQGFLQKNSGFSQKNSRF